MALRREGIVPNGLAATGMYVRKLGSQTLIHAPAKLNLSLEVLFQRSDGFHEIETLMTAVSIFDTLRFTPTDGDDISLTCRWASGPTDQASGDLPEGPDNIVWRAANLLRQRAGVLRGARLHLTKRIPAAAGLGGASSDAAATLVAGNIGWSLGWTRSQLAVVAAELGSDIPFFLGSGAAICRGRGEQIESIASPRLHVVIVRPPVGLATPDVYRSCRPSPAPRSIAALARALAQGQVAAAARLLNNQLEAAAELLTPWIARLRGEFARLDMLGHQMSGSGSSYFGICRHARHARQTAARLRSRRVGTVFAAATTVAPIN